MLPVPAPWRYPAVAPPVACQFSVAAPPWVRQDSVPASKLLERSAACKETRLAVEIMTISFWEEVVIMRGS